MMFNGRLKLIDVDGCVPIDSEVGWVGFEIWRVVFLQNHGLQLAGSRRLASNFKVATGSKGVFMKQWFDIAATQPERCRSMTPPSPSLLATAHQSGPGRDHSKVCWRCLGSWGTASKYLYALVPQHSWLGDEESDCDVDQVPYWWKWEQDHRQASLGRFLGCKGKLQNFFGGKA